MGPALQVIGFVAGVMQMNAAQDNMARAQEASMNAAAEQKNAIAAQQAQADAAARRERRSAIRQTISARAKLRAQAEMAGVGTSSGVQGGLASLSSQLGSNLGYGSQIASLGRDYSAATMRSVDFQAQSGLYSQRADMNQQMSGMGFKLFSLAGGTNVTGANPTSIFSGLFQA